MENIRDHKIDGNAARKRAKKAAQNGQGKNRSSGSRNGWSCDFTHFVAAPEPITLP